MKSILLNKRTSLPAVLVMGWVFMLLSAQPVAAQTPFAMDNVGQKIDSDDARMVGRGSWGMAVVDSMHPGFKNIAGLSRLRHVALKYTGYGEQNSSKDFRGERTTVRTLSPDIRVGMPVIKGRLAVTAGFNIGRSMQYKTRQDTSWFLGGDTTADSLVVNRQFIREGTLFTVPLGVAYEPMAGVAFGGTIGLVNGTIRESLVDFYNGPATVNGTPLYSTNERVQEDEFSGTNTTFSLLLSRWDWLKVGASYTPEYTLDVTRGVVMGGVAGRYEGSYQMKVPMEVRGGIETKLSHRWRFGTDLQLQEFKNFTGREDWQGDMLNEYTVGAGFERLRANARHGGWGNLPLRFGAQYRRWGYWVGQNPVEEKTVSVGTGFPFNHDLGQLDIAFSYSRIGELAKNGMETSVFRFTLSMTGLERWW